MVVPEWIIQTLVGLLAAQMLAAMLAGYGGWVLWQRFYKKDWPKFEAHFDKFQIKFDKLRYEFAILGKTVEIEATRLSAVSSKVRENERELGRLRERIARIEK